MSVGSLDVLAEQSRTRLLAETFEHSMVAKALASLADGSVGDLVEVNAAFCALVGGDREQLIGRASTVLFAPEDHGPMLAVLQEMAGGQRHETVVDRHLVRSDGSRMWITARAVVTHDADGGAYLAIESIECGRQHALAASEAQFRSLFDSSPSGIALVGLDGRWLRVNRAMTDLLGYSADEMADLTFQSLTHPDDLAADKDQIRRLQAGEAQSLQLYKRYVRADGQVIWCLRSATLLRDDAGDPQQFVVQLVDVTEQRHNQELLDAIVSATPDLLLVTTVDGRVVRANAAWAQLGWSEADLHGMDITTMIHPDDVAASYTTAAAVGSGAAGPQQGFINRYRTRDGAYRWLQWNGADLPGQGLLIAIARDVTDSIATQEALRRSEEQSRAAFDASPLGLAIADEHGRFIRVNSAYAAIIGRDPAEVLGRTYREFTHPDDLDVSEHHRLETGRQPGTALRFEKRQVRPDGTVVWTRLGLIAISGPDGQAHRLVQAEDITAEVAARARAMGETGRLRDTLLVQREVTAAAADRDDAVHAVAQRAVQLFPAADGAVVELLDGDGLRYAATAGTLTTALGTRIPVVGSLSGFVLASGMPAYSVDTSTDPRVNRKICADLGIASMIIAPLHAEDTVIGALQISAGSTGAFDDTDEQQLSLLAESLSSALRHADDAARNKALLAERTAALAALKVSETRFKLVFDNSPLGLTLSSTEPGTFGRYLHANPAMTVITGYSTAELTAMSFHDLQHPEDVATTTDYLQQLIAGDRDTVSVERRYRHKDGHTIWVRVAVAVIREDGHARYVVNQIEDITQRREALAQLHRQAALLQLIPAAVIVRGLDGRILWWNQGAEDLYGWPLAAATGKITHRLLATGFPDGSAEADQTDTLCRHGRWEGQLEHITAHGRRVTVLSRQVLRHDDSANSGANDHVGTGLAGTVLEVNTDVTAARAAERALAESEQRFKAQFTNSGVGQVVRGLDGTLLAVNPAYAAMLGHSPQGLTANRDAGELHPDDRADTIGRLAALFAGEVDSFTQEGRLRHSDGHWVDVESTVSLVRDASGRPDHIIGVAADITARRDAERSRDAVTAELAARNSQLEAANRLKLDLIGMLGHEIGNPLTSIRGNAEILADDWAGLDDQHRSRAVDAIARHAHRLGDIVREVLDMVRIEAGAIHAKRTPLSLCAHIEQALTAAGAEHVPVYGDDLHALADGGHLQHILTNLFSNAAKYGGGATAVRIALGDDGHAHVHVEDRGPGVPKEFRSRLFDRLTRADRDASTISGTGLGLYIVSNLAHANYGRVEYAPHPDGGSVFTVTLQTADNSSITSTT